MILDKVAKTASSLGLIPFLKTAATLGNMLPNTRGFLPRTVRTRLANRNGTTRTTTRRRRGRRRNFSGLEINKAEGGFKNITLPYRQQAFGVNCYARLLAVKIGDDWHYRFAPEKENYAGYESYNLKEMLNWSTEFTDRLKTTSQYKVVGVRISITSTNTPSVHENWTKLLLHIRTNKVDVVDPRIQNNVMRLNMNSLGTKNFNFNLNMNNMPKENLEWQDGSRLYGGNIYLKVAEEGYLNINTEETTVVVGDVKVTFVVLTRIQDYMRLNEPYLKATTEEEINELKKENENLKINNKCMQDKLDLLLKDFNKLKLNIPPNEIGDDDEDAEYSEDEEDKKNENNEGSINKAESDTEINTDDNINKTLLPNK